MENDLRLSQIKTRWTLLALAQQRDAPEARDAQAELLPRYCAAVYHYLLSAVHDPSVADDLCQEFAVSFVRGDFRHARPDKGRFRDYVKAALFHLVAKYHQAKRGEMKCVEFDSRIVPREDPPTDADVAFREALRKDFLNRTWTDLQLVCDGPRPNPYAVLRAKADDPSISSAVLADRFAAELGRPVTAANVRQLLHRGREQFAELLRREVAVTVQTTDPIEIDEELAELGLLAYCPRQSLPDKERE